MPEDYFGERVAARYDESAAEIFEPAAVEPVVDFLAELAGDGAALELGIGTGRIALPLAQRGVRVHGIDLSSAMVARLRAKPGRRGRSASRSATSRRRRVDGHVLARLSRLQHDHEPDDAGRAGRVLPERRRAPRARRLLRDRGGGAGSAAAAAGRDRPAVHVSPTQLGFDEYDVAAQGLISHHYRRRRRHGRGGLDPVPLRVAVGARPDGAARRA